MIKKNAPQEQQYCLARDRIRKRIKPPQRYAYALSVTENIENEEPQTYHETITSKKSPQWIVAVNKRI